MSALDAFSMEISEVSEGRLLAFFIFLDGFFSESIGLLLPPDPVDSRARCVASSSSLASRQKAVSSGSTFSAHLSVAACFASAPTAKKFGLALTVRRLTQPPSCSGKSTSGVQSLLDHALLIFSRHCF